MDFKVPVLAKMYGKRQAGYKAIGYKIEFPEDNYRSDQNKTKIYNPCAISQLPSGKICGHVLRSQVQLGNDIRSKKTLDKI